MLGVIQAPLSLILQSIRPQLSLVTGVDPTRIFDVTEDASEVPHFTGERDILLRVDRFTNNAAQTAGAGRIDSRESQILSVIIRTRMNLDKSDRATDWFEDQQRGNDLLKASVLNALHLFWPEDSLGNLILYEPMRIYTGDPPRKDREEKNKMWGATTCHFELGQMLPVTSFDPSQISGQGASAVATPPNGVWAVQAAGAINVTWRVVPGATSYNIYRSTASGPSAIYAVGVGGNAFNDNNIVSGTAYSYQVTSIVRGVESATMSNVAAPSPFISAISPNSSYLQGNEYVVITGNGLASVNAITFGGVNSQYIGGPGGVTTDAEIHASPFPRTSGGSVSLAIMTQSGAASSPFTFDQATIAGTLAYISEVGVSGLGDICNGNDGNLWAATYYGTLWVFSTSGAIIGSQVLTPNIKIQRVIAGSGGKIWAIDQSGLLWRIFTNLSSTVSVALPGANIDNPLIDLCVGPDGNFYIVSSGGDNNTVNNFWKVNDSLEILFATSYVYNSSEPFAYALYGICSSPDDTLFALAFGPELVNILVQFSTAGVALNTWVLPTVVAPGGYGDQITVGPDGNLWTEYFGSGAYGVCIINRANPSLTPTYIQLTSGPESDIVFGNFRAGSDGNMYKEESISGTGGQTVKGNTAHVGYIFQITPNGTVTQYVTDLASSPVSGSNPAVALYGICAGANGAMYVTYTTTTGNNGTLVQLT
jgi:hypothetical protein